MELKHRWVGGAAALVFSAALGAGVVGATGTGVAFAAGVGLEPVVHTGAGGVDYQLTPSENGDAPLPYNTYWQQADQRGCASCHDGLASIVSEMDEEVPSAIGGIQGDVTVSQLVSFYDSRVEGGSAAFADRIHAAHGVDPVALTGDLDCRSCHEAIDDGAEMALWDEVRYDRLVGYTDVPAEELDAATMLEWDQERTVSTEEFFAITLDGSAAVAAEAPADGTSVEAAADDAPVPEATDAEPAGDQLAGEPATEPAAEPATEPAPDSAVDPVFDGWTLSVDGAVGNVASYDLPVLAQLGLPVTEKVCISNAANPLDGGLIGQVEVTGVPMSSIIALSRPDPGANAFVLTAAGGAQSAAIPMSLIDAGNDVLLVYAVDGEAFEEADGYPLVAVVGGRDAACMLGRVDGVTFVTTGGDAASTPAVTPNIGELDTVEGQIIAAGEPYTFGGYAYAYDRPITGMEFSMDRGKSWILYDLEGADFNRWVSWYYTFTPAEGADAAYVLSMRALSGDVEGEVVEISVNARSGE